MSLYREAGRGSARSLIVAGLIALVVGLGIGYLIGHSSAPEPSASKVVTDLRSKLRPIAGGLTLIPGEYAQAYRREGVEAEGVQGAVDRINTQMRAVRSDLSALDPAGTKALEQRIAALEEAVKSKAPPAQVKHAAAAAAVALRNVPGGS
jgi:hypothetical protein